MNQNQKIAMTIVLVNLIAIVLFPPFDQYSIASSKLPVFAGFNLITQRDDYNVINTSVLLLEIFVVLANAGIAWLLLAGRPAQSTRTRFNYQNGVLLFVGINLVLVMLFPPFESVFALTNAAIPTFEGFYFIFNRHPNHTIVTTLLYLEVMFILVNGALLWLIFRRRRPLSPEDLVDLAVQMREQGNTRR